jgi:type VI secretion system secreted protein Hcp
MAVNAYLVLQDRPGPSTSKPDAIDVLSFSFGGSQMAVIGVGASGGETRAGRVDLSSLTIMKVLDKTSPVLFSDMTRGTIIPKATLYYAKPMGDQQTEYFKVELDEVIVSSLQLSGSAENPVESLSLSFARAKMCYNPETADGKLAGWIEKGWDLQKLVAY